MVVDLTEKGDIPLNRTWIDDFIEKITEVEGHFEVYVSIFLKYENQFVFGIKDSKDWVYVDDKRKASVTAFGGKPEDGVDVNNFLKKYCIEKLNIKVDINDSPRTYIDYHHRLKKLPDISPSEEKVRPQMITIVQNPKHLAIPNSLIFTFSGHTKNKPDSKHYSALFLAREQVLVQMFKKEKTAQELKKSGAVFYERIKIPDNLLLYPTGSLNSLLRFLSYEVF